MFQSFALVLFFNILRACVIVDGVVQYTMLSSATPKGSIVEEILMTTAASRLQCTAICAGRLPCRAILYNAMDNSCQIFDTVHVSPPNNMDHTRFYVRDWCPEGFSLLSEVEGPCVKFHLDKATWLEAENNCNLYSPTARLFVADTEQKFQRVKNAGISMNSQFQDAIWIGLSDISSSLRVFKWVNQQPLGSYTYWSNSDFSTNGQNACVVLLRAGYWKWTPTSCALNKHYICEVPSE